MKLFITNLLKIVSIFIVYIIIQLVFFKTILSNYAYLTIPKDKSTLIIGASSLETALDDDIIKGATNLCQGGDFIFYDYIKLKKLYEHNRHIKTVILGFDPENLVGTEFYNPPSMRLQYIRYFFLIEYHDYKDLVFHNSKILMSGIMGLGKYFYKAKSIIRANDIKQIGIGNYLPRPVDGDKLDHDIINKKIDPKVAIDPMTIKYLNKIIKFCNEKSLNLIILNGPAHKSLIDKRGTHKNAYLKLLSKFNNKFVLWDYEAYKIPDSLFFDDDHLNIKGAEYFSIKINHDLIKFNQLN